MIRRAGKKIRLDTIRSVLTTEMVCTYLGVSQQYLYRLVSSNKVVFTGDAVEDLAMLDAYKASRWKR